MSLYFIKREKKYFAYKSRPNNRLKKEEGSNENSSCYLSHRLSVSECGCVWAWRLAVEQTDATGNKNVGQKTTLQLSYSSHLFHVQHEQFTCSLITAATIPQPFHIVPATHRPFVMSWHELFCSLLIIVNVRVTLLAAGVAQLLPSLSRSLLNLWPVKFCIADHSGRAV